MKKLIALVFIALPLEACVTLVGGGGNQTINMMTADNRPAQARILNGTNNFQTMLPSSVGVKRNNSAVTVNVIEDEKTQPTVYSAQPRLNPWFWGNIIIGGLVGSTTDIASGAAWRYDDSVIVPVTRVQSENKQQNGL